jgi:hypothetical protein
MHYASPFSYTLRSSLGYKEVPKFRCEISFASYSREFNLLAFLTFYSPEPKKQSNIKLCCAYRILAERELLLCLKEKNFVPAFVQVLWSLY